MQTFQETDMMAGVNLIAWDGHRKMNRPRRLSFVIAAMLAVSVIVAPKFARFHAHAQEDGQKQNWPWMNTSLSPDERADLVLKEMTLEEKIDLVHGNGMPGWGKPRPNAYLGNGGGGFLLGGAPLGVSVFQISDAADGVRGSGQNRGDSAAVPSDVASPGSSGVGRAIVSAGIAWRDV